MNGIDEGRFQPGGFIVPFKHHSEGRRHIPRQRHRVTNWRDYDAALRNRGSLIVWFTEEALAGWRAQPRKTPGGQPHYSNLAIETALTLRAVFRLALRPSSPDATLPAAAQPCEASALPPQSAPVRPARPTFRRVPRSRSTPSVDPNESNSVAGFYAMKTGQTLPKPAVNRKIFSL